MELQNIAEQLKNGAVGILPTDTLYGLVASAFDVKAVERVYQLKERNPEKAVIILIGSRSDLDQFNITLSEAQQKFIEKYWPGKVSVILPCSTLGVEQLRHLHRGLGSLAFRMPEDKKIRELIAETGPLIAPSANREGEAPATTLAQAKMYFGDEVDFYVDGGTLQNQASTLVALTDDVPVVIRQGDVEVL